MIPTVTMSLTLPRDVYTDLARVAEADQLPIDVILARCIRRVCVIYKARRWQK